MTNTDRIDAAHPTAQEALETEIREARKALSRLERVYAAQYGAALPADTGAAKTVWQVEGKRRGHDSEPWEDCADNYRSAIEAIGEANDLTREKPNMEYRVIEAIHGVTTRRVVHYVNIDKLPPPPAGGKEG